MAELSAISEWADGLLANLAPSARRTLARELAKDLRQSQQKRIAAQQNPDGTPFAPRSTKIRRMKGKTKRQMFSKLRTARFLKVQSSPNAAVVEFAGNVQRMAQVHQGGLRDRVSRRPGAPEVQYPARELLGMSDAELSRIREIIIGHLAA